MADITMCTDKTCPKSQRCERMQAKPGPMQSYAYFERNGSECVFFHRTRLHTVRLLRLQMRRGVFMIKKPEDAKPRIANLFTESGQMIPQPVRVFTASETAQIARQFAASLMCAPECDTDEFERWQKLFDEWQK